MITITRSLARHLRAVFRRAGIKSRGGAAPPLSFHAGADGLRIQSLSPHIALEYHQPGEYPTEQLTVPVSILDDCQGKTDEPVTLESRPKKKVVAAWQDKEIPQHAEFDAVPVRQSYPAPPDSFAVVEQSFWQALRDAAACTDHESLRYALGNIHLRSAGGVVTAADGRQLFQQGGFQFPWSGDVMVPALGVLGCTELAGTGPIEIGKSEKHLALRIARWTLVLTIDAAGRFPKIEETVKDADAGGTTLRLSPADAEFLARALPRLPHHEESANQPITLDVDGQTFVRARGAEGTPITELHLSGASSSGAPVRIAINRSYLERALAFGLTDIRFKSTTAALLAFDNRRRYIWMPLAPDAALGPSRDAIRIQSAASAAGSEQSSSLSTLRPRNTTMSIQHTQSTTTADAADTAGPMPAAETSPVGQNAGATLQVAEPPSESPNESSGQAAANGQARRGRSRKSAKSTAAGPIEQAILLRDALRDSVNKTNELIRTLKRQRQQSRLVQSTLASLKELQRAG